MNNPFSEPLPWNKVSKGYEEVTQKILGNYSKAAIPKANLTPESNVLDVACGPGTLSRLIAKEVATIQAVDFAEEMAQLFQNHINKEDLKNITVQVADGQNLPFVDNSFDAAFSMFGLMFFPDRVKGFKELHRTLKPGGKAIVSSWAPIEESPAMLMMFSALKAANPNMPERPNTLDSLENPDVFQSEMEAAGFKDIEIERVTMGMDFPSAEAFWSDMVKGSAPIVMLKDSVSPEDWESMQAKALEYLSEAFGPTPRTLTSDAWIGSGSK